MTQFQIPHCIYPLRSYHLFWYNIKKEYLQLPEMTIKTFLPFPTTFMKEFCKGWPPGWYCRTSTSWLEFLGSDCCNLLKMFSHPRMRYSPADQLLPTWDVRISPHLPSSLASSLSVNTKH